MRDFFQSAKVLFVLMTLLGGGGLPALLPALAAPPQGPNAPERTGRPRPVSSADPAVRQFPAQAAHEAASQEAAALATSPRGPDAPEQTGRPRPVISADPVVRQFLAQAAHEAASQAASQEAAAPPSCARCHDSQLAARNAGGHKAIACETCHGPQASHVASDGKEKPAKPNVIPLCLNCHEKDAAKPAGRPQVDKAEHYNGTTCSDCHLPHAPKM